MTVSLLPLHFEPQYTLIINISKLNDAATCTMTLPRLSKTKKQAVGGPIPGNLHPLPKITGIIISHISL